MWKERSVLIRQVIYSSEICLKTGPQKYIFYSSDIIIKCSIIENELLHLIL